MSDPILPFPELGEPPSNPDELENLAYLALKVCLAWDAWKRDMRQRPELAPGEVIRPSFALLAECLEDLRHAL